MGKQVEMLKNHTHFLTYNVKLPVGHGCQILALKENLSGGRLLQPVQTAEKGAFAGTGGTDDDRLLTLFNCGGDALENMQIPKGLLQILNLDHSLPASFPVWIPWH